MMQQLCQKGEKRHTRLFPGKEQQGRREASTPVDSDRLGPLLWPLLGKILLLLEGVGWSESP